MKKAILAVVILGAVAFAIYKLSRTQLNIGFLQGKTAFVGRGDLTIPITATGEIEPKARSEIKPDASGKVVEIPVDPGEIVPKDALIIRLDPIDEQRSVTRAQNDVDRAKASLEQQRFVLQEKKTSSIAQIDARIDAIDAQLIDAKFQLDKLRNMREDVRREDEIVRAQAQYDQLFAQRNGLLADRQQAEIAIDLAERDVVLAEKAYESAQTTLGDAQKRLSETEVRSPIDGMISKISVEKGEVVQGGRTTFTGGTALATVADISDIFVRTEVSDADIGAVLWLAPPEARPGGQTLATELEQADTPLVSTAGLLENITTTGTPVKIRVDSFREEEFTGVIERIFPEPKKVQNIVTYLCDIRVTSPNAKMLALVLGMQADVEFTAQSVHNVVLVPHDAIRRGPGGDLGVYVPEKVPDRKDRRPRFVACSFGLDNGLYAELRRGEEIKAGTEVYVELPANFGSGEGEEE